MISYIAGENPKKIAYIESQVFGPFLTLALKIIDYYVIEGCLIYEAVVFDVDHLSEVLHWQNTFNTSGENDLIL